MTRLHLRAEHLTELTTDDLHRVVGADTVGTVAGTCTPVTGVPTLQRCTTFPSCGCEITEPC